MCNYRTDPYDPEDESGERRLPRLHEVLGDVLEQSSRPSPSRRESHDRRRSTGYNTTPNTHDLNLAPLAQRPVYSSRYHVNAPGAHSSSSNYQPLPSPHPHSPSQPHPSSRSYSPTYSSPRSPTTQHSYHLFNYNPNQGLVHQRSSSQDDLEPSQPRPRLPPSDPARKYVCAECGNRFSKHSTLRNHLLTHSGERPFACTYLGCGRRFSMACNMQRHMRTHTSASAFLIEQSSDGYGETTQPSSRGGSVSSRAGSSRGDSPRADTGRYRGAS